MTPRGRAVEAGSRRVARFSARSLPESGPECAEKTKLHRETGRNGSGLVHGTEHRTTEPGWRGRGDAAPAHLAGLSRSFSEVRPPDAVVIEERRRPVRHDN
jgi:hypothetical protein